MADNKKRPKTTTNSSKKQGSVKKGTSSANQHTSSKKSSSKQSKGSKSNKKGKKKKSLFWRVIKIQLLILFIAFLAIAGLFYFRYGQNIIGMIKDAKQAVEESTPETFKAAETSLVYDTNKKLIKTIKSEKEVYYLEYKDIPQYAIDAMVSIEDKKFYEHHGIDFKANVRAVLGVLLNKPAGGGSTITQQLSRNVFLTTSFSYERKIKEIVVAYHLEKKYTKDQIMEFYLNNIYFANGYYGIQAASKGYFNKDVNKLSLSQIATLCAIPNSPNMYNPRENLDNTLVRRNRILKNMYEDGVITEKQYKTAVAEKIKIKNKKSTVHNYVETFIYDSAIKALMKKDGFKFQYVFPSTKEKETYNERYNEVYARYQKKLKTAGYRIYTSIDMEKQELLQEAVNDGLSMFTDTNEEGIYEMQSGAVSIDNDTGRVVAIVGGRTQDNVNGYTLNRGFQTYRQPGSTIKPLVVYTPAFEKLGYNPESIVNDSEIEDGPKNTGDSYLGKITLREAVERSKNVVAWRIYEELTPQVGVNYLKEMEFSKLADEDFRNMSTSLGGFHTGVSVLEMASGFATIENDGVYREPTCIVKIQDSSGKTIVSDAIHTKLIYSGNAARMMTDVLKGVFQSHGTAASIGGIYNMDSAGKTGTTNDNRDGWFCGYTPYYTTAVWVGYDQPRSIYDLWGSSYPARIWKQYMSKIHEGLERRTFEPYISNGVKNMVEPDTTEEVVEESTTEATTEVTTEEVTTEVTTEITTEATEATTENQKPTTEATTEKQEPTTEATTEKQEPTTEKPVEQEPPQEEEPEQGDGGQEEQPPEESQGIE